MCKYTCNNSKIRGYEFERKGGYMEGFGGRKGRGNTVTKL